MRQGTTRTVAVLIVDTQLGLLASQSQLLFAKNLHAPVGMLRISLPRPDHLELKLYFCVGTTHDAESLLMDIKLV